MKPCLLLAMALALCGCAGGKLRIVARSVQPPVSYTGCVFDGSGQICRASTNQVLKHFEISRTSWSMAWKSIPLNSREWDMSAELSSELKQAPGNAIVNLTVRPEGCNLLHWFLASLVPIIPSYVSVKAEGDIVRLPENP